MCYNRIKRVRRAEIGKHRARQIHLKKANTISMCWAKPKAVYIKARRGVVYSA